MKITVGRDPDCTIVISEDYDIVSNEHADIELQGSDILFTDHSSNGTIINGQKIQGRSVKIFPNDNIMLAGVCKLEWSHINQYIPRQGRPTVVHNIRNNVTMPPNMQNGQQPGFGTGQSYGQEQSQLQERSAFPQSRPTDLYHPQPVDNGNMQRRTSEWDVPQRSKITEQWNSDDQPPMGTDTSVNNSNGTSLTLRDQRELGKWNWGAFYFGWLWGAFHKVYMALIQLLLILLPIVFRLLGINPLIGLTISSIGMLAIAVWLGIKGTQMAWDKKAWRSIDHMKQSRHNWNIAALICFLVSLVLSLIMTLLFIDLLLSIL